VRFLAAGRRFFAVERFLAAGRRFFAVERFFAAGRRFFAVERFLAAGRRFFAVERFLAAGRRFFAVERFFAAGRRFFAVERFFAAGRRFFAVERFLAAGRRFFAVVRFLAVLRFFAGRFFAVVRFFALDVARLFAEVRRALDDALRFVVAFRFLALRFVVFLPLAVLATLSRSFRSRFLRLRKLVPASFTSFSASRSWASFNSVLPPFLSSSRISRRAFCDASSDAFARSIAVFPLRREEELFLRAGARFVVRLRALLLRVAAIHTPLRFKLLRAA
jgi:hypothetical protein